jgi:hypothetical protein
MKFLMKIRLLLPFLLGCVSTLALGAARGSWLAARIVEVRKSVESKPLYWIANTPVTKDETTYTVSVHLVQSLLIGVYTVDKLHPEPPIEWVRGHPVKVQLDGDDMYLKPLTGYDIKLHIVKRKSAEVMQPVKDAEMKEAYAPPAPAESLTGLAESDAKSITTESKNIDERAQTETPALGQPIKKNLGPSGTIDVTTIPYLAEIYIDGVSVGYSPAKLQLPAGQHLLRAEKDGYQTWSKDITVRDSSEFTVYAELKKK